MTQTVLIISTIAYSLSEIGTWIQDNLSVEGLIALPALMASFLIALAIYNFEDSKKGLSVDAATIMTQVVKVPYVIWSFILVSGVVVFFEVSAELAWLLPILTVIYLAGLLLLVQSLQRSYLWARSLESITSGNIRTSMRKEYISSLKDEEMLSAWEKIWHADEDSRKLISQRDLVRLFTSSIKKSSISSSVSGAMVRDLISVIDTIDLGDPEIMDQLIGFCLTEARGLAVKPAKDDSNFDKIHFTTGVTRLFVEILKISLNKNDNTLYSLIHASREYLNKNGLNEEQFVKILSANLLNTIKDDNDKEWVWHIVPNEWKVTSKNLKNTKTQKAAFAWLNSYARLLNSMPLYTKPGELNMPLQSITAELLPDADPMLWAKLFSFHWSPYGVNKGESSEHAQVRNYLDNNLSFGFMGHVHTQYGEYDNETARDAVEREEQEVIDIAVNTTLFGFFHDDQVMKRYLAAIKQLKDEYDKDEDKLNKLLYLEAILRRIQKQIRVKRRKK